MIKIISTLTPIYSYQQLKRIDNHAIQGGLEASILMENAGRAAWNYIKSRWPKAKKILIICGIGNNGGDGWILALLAQAQGIKVSVYEVEQSPPSSQRAIEARRDFLKKNQIENELDFSYEGDLIVDALLGIGARLPLKPEWESVIKWMNQQSQPILSLDVPSGLTASSVKGSNSIVNATETLSFIAAKWSFFTPQGLSVTGRWTVADIGIPASVYRRHAPLAQVLDFEWARRALNPRQPDAHKGHYGHVVILGSCENEYAGAGQLAGMAALRGGAGKVTLATQLATLEHRSAGPELMVKNITQFKEWTELAQKASVLVLGPGLGQKIAVKKMLTHAISLNKPMVVDADGLNLLAQSPQYNSNWILTPHPGEAARLLGVTTTQIQSNRLKSVKALAKKYGGVVVLKGAGTLVASEGHCPLICKEAVPSLASAGMGDVLAGLIGGLLAQNMTLWHAASLGVIVHALAAKSFNLERGLLASDLLKPIVELINK